jgi:hypothetical protein
MAQRGLVVNKADWVEGHLSENIENHSEWVPAVDNPNLILQGVDDEGAEILDTHLLKFINLNK